MAQRKPKKTAQRTARKPAQKRATRPARASAGRSKKPAGRSKKPAGRPAKKRTAARRTSAPTRRATAAPRKPVKKSKAVAARKPAKTSTAKRPSAKPKATAKPLKAALAPKPAVAPKATKSAAPRRVTTPPPARLQRERRRLPEADAFENVSDDSRLMSSARAGHDELRSELQKHTESSPAMTAGDVDAKWQDAYALGDEAPGGDNMTPDQDRVDDIGKALGIEYADDEELLGGDELLERDEHRWELDPASKEDEDL